MELFIHIFLPEKKAKGGRLKDTFFKKTWSYEEHILKTTLEFIGLLLFPWKFRAKESFTPRNSEKLYYRPRKFFIFS